MGTITDVLPVEILMKIFHMLDPQDMKMVVLVCQMWREMGEDPNLWTWCKISLPSRDALKMMNTVRFQLVQDVKLLYPRDWKAGHAEELFQCLERLSNLRRVSGIEYVDISLVQPSLLVRVVSMLEVVGYWMGSGISLTPQPGQAETLVGAIADQSLVRIYFILGLDKMLSLYPFEC